MIASPCTEPCQSVSILWPSNWTQSNLNLFTFLSAILVLVEWDKASDGRMIWDCRQKMIPQILEQDVEEFRTSTIHLKTLNVSMSFIWKLSQCLHRCSHTALHLWWTSPQPWIFRMGCCVGYSWILWDIVGYCVGRTNWGADSRTWILGSVLLCVNLVRKKICIDCC